MKSNIYGRLVELADLNLQRKLWLNEQNDPGLISSYPELMSSLFLSHRTRITPLDLVEAWNQLITHMALLW